jgi:D-alanyl-D-alanine carboxypeptidase (penicillin-binding protein 5/6)
MKFTLLLLLALVLPVCAQAKINRFDKHPVPSENNQTQALKLSADAYLLYDYTSKQILLEQNSHDRIEPASLTKLMTAYLTFAALKQDKISGNQKIIPSAQAVRFQQMDARMFLDHKKSVSIDELIHGLIIISANDAARVLAETIAGSEALFAEQMNKEAERLGMHDTHFVNSSGLPDPLHYSSAYDIALLSAAIVNNFPEHFPLYSQREYVYNHVKHYNRNRLLWLDSNVDGMKTGHTESAGYSLVATANRKNHRLISVVIGTGSENLRSTESQRLLNYGFQNFEMFQIYKHNETVRDIRIWKGTENTVKAGLRDGLILTLPKKQRELIKATVETQQPLLAPIDNGQQVGVLKLTLEGKPYLELPLVALESVPLVNIFSRGIDSIRMIFSQY